MAGGKLSPRQKMINMMYLVLLALLAMNVSNEVLNAFHMVNEGLQTSNMSLQGKNTGIYTAFDKQMQQDANKAKPFYDKAKVAQKACDTLYSILDKYKKEIITKAELDEETGDLKRREDLDIATRLFVEEGDGGNLRGIALQKKIRETREVLKGLIDEKDRAGFKLPLTDSISRSRDNKKAAWEYAAFNHVPATAALTILSKFENDVIASEGAVIEYLIKKIGETDFKFTDLTAKIIAPSSYILDGSPYKADVFLAAFNSTQNPEIFLGPLGGFKKNPDGSYEAREDITTPLPPGYSDKAMQAEGGFGKYSTVGAGIGEKTYTGVIRVKNPKGGYKFYPFEGKYQTAPKAVVVSPTKMNVLYIGVDNPMEVSVPGVSQNDVGASIVGAGTLAKDPTNPSNYIAKVTSVGKCKISVTAKMDGKVQPMGDKEFRIKRIPDPVPTLGGKLRGGNTQPGAIKAQSGVVALLENFDFEARFNVVSFQMVFSSKGEIFKAEATGPIFNANMKSFLDRAKPKDIIFIDEIKVVGPDNQPRKLGQIAFTII